MNIKNPRAEELARQLAEETGESITNAVLVALDERLSRIRAGRRTDQDFEELMELARACSSLPDIDSRSPDEILGYDESGLP